MCPALPAEQFKRLNLMAGTAKSLEQELLTPEDREVWDRDFALLCDDLTKLVDPELGADLRAEKAFYDAANQVAKGYFDKTPFGGLKAATGQYGFRLVAAQDLKETAGVVTPALHSWVQTVTTIQSGSYINSGWGFGNAAINAVFACNLSSHKAVIAFHRLISYKPSPRVIHVEFNVNDYPYVPYTVEPYSKITKENKLFKIIPMPGRIILHPGGKFYVQLYFDRLTGQEPPAGTADIDIEIGLFGLVFGEYDYLEAANLV